MINIYNVSNKRQGCKKKKRHLFGFIWILGIAVQKTEIKAAAQIVLQRDKGAWDF